MATRKKANPAPVQPAPVQPAPVQHMTAKEMAELLKGKFVQAVSEVANDAHAESVTEQIIKDLNVQKRQVTLKLLGLDDHWGKWQVDHCNGRESPITKYIAVSAGETIKAWVNEAVKEVLTTDMKAEIMQDAKKAIHKEVRDMVRNKTTSYELGKFAKPVVDSWLQQAADEVRVELGIKTTYQGEE